MQRRIFLLSSFALAAAPGAALAQAQQAAPEPRPGVPLTQIVPENDLERAFLNAFTNPDLRLEFRRQLLESQVSLALVSSAEDSPPRLVDLPEGRGQAGFVFTSSARQSSIFGPSSPRQITRGRLALRRLAGKNVILNYRLAPMLTLEPEDVANYLETQITLPGPTQ